MNTADKLKIGKWILKYKYSYEKFNFMNFPWKIDGFRYEINEGDYINFIHDIEDSNINYDFSCIPENKVYVEHNGFQQYIIYEDKHKNLTWTLRKSSNKENILVYKINNKWDKWDLIYDATKTNGKYAFEYLHQIFSYSVLNHGGIVLHGVLMEYNGRGIIISAPSGTGKTTHARLWRDNENALIINGDRALCGKDDDSGKWTGYGMPWCGTSGEYINRKVPISAIVVLERDDENSIEKLEILDGFIHMLPNVIAPNWEEKLMNNAVDMLQDMIENIPVYKLKCRPDLDAVKVLKAEIDKL